jgi:hypothetical protein
MSKIDLSRYLSAAMRIRVPFFDLDPAGVAWHGRYFQYFSTTQVPVDADSLDLLLGSPDFFVENVRSRMEEAGLVKD